MKARYICFEGTEGVGKTTQTLKLVNALEGRGYRVLQTKEPGTSHIPLTMALRGIMLDNQYDNVLTKPAREMISQVIRSIHMERLVLPSLYEYDFIIQDRGVLSGLSYGEACGNDIRWLWELADKVMPIDDYTQQPVNYDHIVYLTGDSRKNLVRGKNSKQEFQTGDAMESQGDDFMDKVSSNMDLYSKSFNTVRIYVDGKTIEQVHNEILSGLGLEIK